MICCRTAANWHGAKAGAGGVTLLDASVERFHGDVPQPLSGAGHIPGAINVPAVVSWPTTARSWQWRHLTHCPTTASITVAAWVSTALHRRGTGDRPGCGADFQESWSGVRIRPVRRPWHCIVRRRPSFWESSVTPGGVVGAAMLINENWTGSPAGNIGLYTAGRNGRRVHQCAAAKSPGQPRQKPKFLPSLRDVQDC